MSAVNAMASAPGADSISGEHSAARPMSERQKMLGFLIMALGAFLAFLDIQIVASSLAEIQAGLSATPEEISRVQTWYLVAEVIMIPLTGWLSRALSTRWLFTISAAGFTVASLACAAAWNLESMIMFRAIQGFLGGAMIPTAFATGYALFPGSKQTRVAAVLGIVGTCAPALGPTLGGYITEAWGWRWMFAINLVPGIAIAILIPRVLRFDQPQLHLFRRLDIAGVVTLAVFLGCLQYVLDEGPRNSWFEDSTITSLSSISLIAGVLFISRSLTANEPIVDLRAFRNRNFTLGCLLSFIVGIGLYGMVAMTSLFLTEVRELNAVQVGETVLVFGLSQLLSTPIVAILSRKLDARVQLGFGFLLYAISTWLLCDITSEWGFDQLLISQVVRAFASMNCIIVVTNVALGTLATHELKNTSGLFNLMRNLGGAIGLALLNTQLFYTRFETHYGQLAASLTERRLAMAFVPVETGESSDPSQLMIALMRIMGREALTMSFADMFLVVGACFAIAFLLVPWIGRVKVTTPQEG